MSMKKSSRLAHRSVTINTVKMSTKNKLQQGYITLMIVLIVTALTAIVALSLLLSGVDTSRGSFATVESYQARALATGCIEKALYVIRYDNRSTDQGTIAYNEGSCTYSFASGANNTITIRSSGIVDTVTKKIEVLVDTSNYKIQIASWNEAPTF